MANHFFQFKQFTVYQQHSAMKVCTDACLFGAWVAQILTDTQLESPFILDIGAGTGLLSLMLAQQCTSSIIHAVEIDAAAAGEAGENFARAPWHNRLQVFNTAIQSFSPAQPYQFIITNPPFFQSDLASTNLQRNVALHSHQLSLDALLMAIQKLVAADGHFVILLPYHRTRCFEEIAQNAGFHLHQKTTVHQTPAHPPFRSMLLFGSKQQPTKQSSIIIKDKGGDYTAAFVALLKNYYLYL